MDHIIPSFEPWGSHLPISEIRKMGGDLCRGVYALQKHEICIGDLSPARCLLDGPGILKINNLSCAHFENEEIESVYQSVMEEMNSGIEQDSLDDQISTSPFSSPVRSIEHHSPEALIGHVTLQSDIWSLGAVLYQMYSGKCPYQGGEIDDILMAMKKEPPAELISKMALIDENSKLDDFVLFRDLLSKLLVMEPEKRPTIEQVFKHEFWNGKLKLDNEINNDESGKSPNKAPTPSKMSDKEPTIRNSLDTNHSFDSNKTLTNSMLNCESENCAKKPSEIQPDASLKRQKTELLRSLNSRRASRTNMSETCSLSIKESSSMPLQSVTRMSSAMDGDAHDMTQEKNENPSSSILETVPNKKRTFSASVPKTPSASDFLVDLGDEGDEYTTASLLVHKSEHPNVDGFLHRNRKDTLTKYEMRNLPQNLTEIEIDNIDSDDTWRALFSDIQKILTEQNNKIQIGALGWMCAEITKVREFSRQFWLATSFVTFCCKALRLGYAPYPPIFGWYFWSVYRIFWPSFEFKNREKDSPYHFKNTHLPTK